MKGKLTLFSLVTSASLLFLMSTSLPCRYQLSFTSDYLDGQHKPVALTPIYLVKILASMSDLKECLHSLKLGCFPQL